MRRLTPRQHSVNNLAFVLADGAGAGGARLRSGFDDAARSD